MCFSPVRIMDHGEIRYYPCGKCLQCLKAYQDMWCSRLNEELKCWQRFAGRYPVVFFTLDYDPEHVPCSYLVLTNSGVRFTFDKPNCEIRRFWRDSKESYKSWLVRRKSMLGEYWRYVRSLKDNNYILFPDDPYFSEIEPEFKVFPNGTLEHPDWDCFGSDLRVPRHSVNLAIDNVDILAFEFHTVYKKDVQNWLKRCRMRIARALPSVFGTDCNPRFNRYWRDLDGEVHSLPSSAVPNTFKYFITSEYGPKTHRPHYHGVLFGVTQQEFKEYFESDWLCGRVVYEHLRPTGGAMLYVAKYCAKGEYDHPYCKKDYFYNSGEYHSQDYEDVIADFGLHQALVRPTFHLISKGLGAGYCFNSEILNYFGASLCGYLTESGRLRYVCSDQASVPNVMPDHINKYLRINPTGKSDSVCVELEWLDDDMCLRVNKYSTQAGERKFLIGTSYIPLDSIVDYSYESIVSSLKYSRTYVTCSSPSPVRPFNRSELPVQGDTLRLKTCQTSISLPRYYRQWLVSPLVSLLRQNFAVRVHPNKDVQRARIIQRLGHTHQAMVEIEQNAVAEKIMQADCKVLT